MAEHYHIKKLDTGCLADALALVWEVFSEFEAPEYSPEGVREFKSFLDPERIRAKLANGEIFMWGCFDGDRIIGVIAGDPRCHINLLFVDKEHHRRGIARALLQRLLDHFEAEGGHTGMTVNSSPYAVEAYRRMGFVPTGGEQTVNGIRFVPMKRPL